MEWCVLIKATLVMTRLNEHATSRDPPSRYARLRPPEVGAPRLRPPVPAGCVSHGTRPDIFQTGQRRELRESTRGMRIEKNEAPH